MCPHSPFLRLYDLRQFFKAVCSLKVMQSGLQQLIINLTLDIQNFKHE